MPHWPKGCYWYKNLNFGDRGVVNLACGPQNCETVDDCGNNVTKMMMIDHDSNGDQMATTMMLIIIDDDDNSDDEIAYLHPSQFNN